MKQDLRLARRLVAALLRWPQITLIGLVKAYRLLLSPWLGSMFVLS